MCVGKVNVLCVSKVIVVCAGRVHTACVSSSDIARAHYVIHRV